MSNITENFTTTALPYSLKNDLSTNNISVESYVNLHEVSIPKTDTYLSPYEQNHMAISLELDKHTPFPVSDNVRNLSILYDQLYLQSQLQSEIELGIFF